MASARSASRVDVGVAARLFHGLSDPTRLSILLELLDGERRVTTWCRRSGRRSRTCRTTWRACSECGLVVDRPGERRQVFYSIAHPELRRPAGGDGAVAGRGRPRGAAVHEPVDGRRRAVMGDACCGGDPAADRSPEAGDRVAERWRTLAAVVAAVAWLVGVGRRARPAQRRCGDGPCSSWRSSPVGRRSCPAALRGLVTGRLGVGLLMTIAAVGAVVLGEFGEAAALAFLFSISEALEEWAVTRSRRGLRAVLGAGARHHPASAGRRRSSRCRPATSSSAT